MLTMYNLLNFVIKRKEMVSWVTTDIFCFCQEDIWESRAYKIAVKSSPFVSLRIEAIFPLLETEFFPVDYFHQHRVAEMALCNFWKWTWRVQKLSPFILGSLLLGIQQTCSENSPGGVSLEENQTTFGWQLKPKAECQVSITSQPWEQASLEIFPSIELVVGCGPG